MRYTFQSPFAERLDKFVEQKNALGFPYIVSTGVLASFDKFCLSRFPAKTELTKEVCAAWAVKRDTECNNSFYNRVVPIREFARYLISTGEHAHIVPAGLIPRNTRYVPYIYSEQELIAFWGVLDNISPRKGNHVKRLVLPVIFRLIYCCGLRPSESLKLRVEDVDFMVGKLYITESKGHKNRIVMMSDDVTEMLRRYVEKISTIMPDRVHFFPDPRGGAYTADWLRKQFLSSWHKTGIEHAGKNRPRVYDFRHSFATHRLYRWMKEGKEMTAMIPYLSSYMGHTLLSATYYYIHLVPGQFESMSDFDCSKLEDLLPEVRDDE
jgi:integrase